MKRSKEADPGKNPSGSVKANFGYNEISVITNWFCYPQWAIMPLETNQPLSTNHKFGPCEKFKLDITKWLLSIGDHFSEMDGKFAEMYTVSYLNHRQATNTRSVASESLCGLRVSLVSSLYACNHESFV